MLRLCLGITVPWKKGWHHGQSRGRIVAQPEVTKSLDSRGISVSQKQLQILRRCAPLDDSAVGRLWACDPGCW